MVHREDNLIDEQYPGDYFIKKFFYLTSADAEGAFVISENLARFSPPSGASKVSL